MTNVTTIVFITEHQSEEKRFQELFGLYYSHMGAGYIPYPVRDSGPNCVSTKVFFLGVPYAGPALMRALREERWGDGTVLYIHEENHEGPEVHVGTDYLLESRFGF